MNINKAFPSKYLKASDLDTEMQVKIKSIAFEEVGPQKDRRPVAYFEGIEKGVVLNKTRSNGIVRASGSEETNDWPGTLVLLYPSTTQFQGEEVECIGIRAPRQEKKKDAKKKDASTGEPESQDWPPADREPDDGAADIDEARQHRDGPRRPAAAPRRSPQRPQRGAGHRGSREACGK